METVSSFMQKNTFFWLTTKWTMESIYLPILSNASSLLQFRQVKMRTQLQNLKVPYRIVPGVNRCDYCDVTNLKTQNIRNALLVCNNSSYDSCVIMEDDVVFISKFVSELNHTIQQLPKQWQVFHMCPGFVWGRRDNKRHTRLIRYDPEFRVKASTARRYFSSWPSDRGWVGGPIAFLIKKEHVSQMLSIFEGGIPNDVSMTKNHKQNHFVARDPPLCRERSGPSSW